MVMGDGSRRGHRRAMRSEFGRLPRTRKMSAIKAARKSTRPTVYPECRNCGMDEPEIRGDNAVLYRSHSGVLRPLPVMDIELEKCTKRGHNDFISDHCDRSDNEGQNDKDEFEDWECCDQANRARPETPQSYAGLAAMLKELRTDVSGDCIDSQVETSISQGWKGS